MKEEKIWHLHLDSTANTHDLEAELDRLVYALYGLTGEEIRIVEGREA